MSDCGGPQRHADCALSSHEQVIQRHAGPRLSNRDYLASGDDDVAAGAPQGLRSDCVLSNDGQITGLRPITGGPHSFERGGGATSPDTRQGSEGGAADITTMPRQNPSLTPDAMIIDQLFSTTPTTSSSTPCPPRAGRRQQTKKKPVNLQKRSTPYIRPPSTP